MSLAAGERKKETVQIEVLRGCKNRAKCRTNVTAFVELHFINPETGETHLQSHPRSNASNDSPVAAPVNEVRRYDCLACKCYCGRYFVTVSNDLPAMTVDGELWTLL